MQAAFTDEFIGQCALRLEENYDRIKKCMDSLGESEVWQRPNGQLVSIANLVVHLCGNITQYIISSLGGAPDNRERNKEFSITGGYTKQQLLHQLETTIATAITIMRKTAGEELLHVHTVQGFRMSGIAIIVHVTEHLSYHTGQIAFATKLLKEKDLGFYAGLDLDVKNEI
jgi:uncharacterized damage-inducible protein DinB